MVVVLKHLPLKITDQFTVTQKYKFSYVSEFCLYAVQDAGKLSYEGCIQDHC